MKMTLRGALLGLVAAAILTAAPPTPSEALFGLFKKKEQVVEGGQTGPASVNSSDAAAKISEYRRSRGLPAVTVDSTLTAIATSQAQAMARARKMSHSLGGSFPSRLNRGGYDALIAAENLAAGPRNLDEVIVELARIQGPQRQPPQGRRHARSASPSPTRRTTSTGTTGRWCSAPPTPGRGRGPTRGPDISAAPQ